MNREVRDWLSNLVIAVLLAVLALLLVLPAQAQQLTCTRADVAGGGFTLTCAPPASAPTPAPPPPDPAPLPSPGPTPASVCTGLSPQFMAGLDQGLDLSTIVLWRVGRALTPAELACARERGVPGSQVTTQPPGRPVAADGFDRSPDFGWQFGRIKSVEGPDGTARWFTFRPPPGWRGVVRLVTSEGVSRYGLVRLVEITDPDGRVHRGSGRLSSPNYEVRRDGVHRFAVRIIGGGRVAVQIRLG